MRAESQPYLIYHLPFVLVQGSTMLFGGFSITINPFLMNTKCLCRPKQKANQWR